MKNYLEDYIDYLGYKEMIIEDTIAKILETGEFDEAVDRDDLDEEDIEYIRERIENEY